MVWTFKEFFEIGGEKKIEVKKARCKKKKEIFFFERDE